MIFVAIQANDPERNCVHYSLKNQRLKRATKHLRSSRPISLLTSSNNNNNNNLLQIYIYRQCIILQ
jgi:hypothetical protein